MNVLTNEEFAAKVLALARPEVPFKPTATYDPDGDCVEFLTTAEPFYAERVDDLVTVYYSQETHEVIGSLLKGISVFCENVLEHLPGFQLEIIDGKVKLVHVFQASMWMKSREPQATITYRKLIKKAEETKMEVPLRKAG